MLSIKQSSNKKLIRHQQKYNNRIDKGDTDDYID